MISDIEAMLRGSVVLPDRREIWEWAADNVDFGSSEAFKGAYDVENVPQTREFLRALRDPEVREVTFVGPPQESGKTKAVETFMSWRIACEPAKMSFNLPTNAKSEQWSETRWEPMLNACPVVKTRFSDNRHLKKKRRIIFNNGTFLLIQGAEVDGNRAGDSVEVQVNDECRMWEKPWMRQMHGRTGAYRATRKIVNISVGGKKGSELHERFLAGNQGEWSHRCPRCDEPFAYVFDHRHPLFNVKFDIGAALLHADGRLDLREFARSVHVDCPACGHAMEWDPERLAAMQRRGIYVDRNPNPDPGVRSYHCNSFALGKTPWSEILEPWVRLHIRGGVFDPKVLEEFIIQPLAEFWDERPYVVNADLKTEDYRREDVIRPGGWKAEAFRVFTADNQRGSKGDVPHRWFSCWAFASDGVLRLVDAGRIDEWDDVKRKQVELGVPEPTEVAPGPWSVIDRNYDPTTVDERAAMFKWYGMQGTDRDEFVHGPTSPFAGTRQLFSEPRAIDIGYGTAEAGRQAAWYFLWSSQRIQDLVARLRNEGKIQFPRDWAEWCPTLAVQLNSHRQIKEETPKKGERLFWKRIGDAPDHLLDCLCEAVVCGCIAGIYKPEQYNTPPSGETPPAP